MICESYGSEPGDVDEGSLCEPDGSEPGDVHDGSLSMYGDFGLGQKYIMSTELLTRDTELTVAVHMNSDRLDHLRHVNIQQLKRAREVRHVQQSLGYRPTQAISHMVRNGFLTGVPVEMDVIRVADEILGRPVQVTKAKARKKKTPRFLIYQHLVADQLAIEVDLMQWFGHMFFVGVTVPYSHTFVEHLGVTRSKESTKDIQTMINTMDTCTAYYHGLRYDIKYVVFDGESSLNSDTVSNHLRRKGILPIGLSSGQHAHRVERKQGVIKDYARVLKNLWPTSVPHSIVPSMVKGAVFQINTNLHRGNENKLPPYLAITRQASMSYEELFKISFGDPCQVHADLQIPSKADDYAFDGIALYPELDDISSGYWFLNLRTLRITKRRNFTRQRSYTEDTIERLIQLYETDIRKAAKVPRVETDTEPYANLRFDPVNTRRVSTIATLGNPVASIEEYADRKAMELYAKMEKSMSEFRQRPPPKEKTRVETIGDVWMACLPDIEWEALHYAASLTLKKGLRLYGHRAREAIRKELRGIIDRQVFSGVHYHRLTKEQKKFLRSKFIISEKRINGVLERIKARLVVLGHLQDTKDFLPSELSSPTPAQHTVMMQAAIAAAEGREVITFDIGQAFLNADVNDKGQVVLHLSKEVSEVLVEMEPAYKQYLRHDGSILVKLIKALYGLRQSPKLWNDAISAFLVGKLGFTRSELDNCYFTKVNDDGSKMDLCLHVDDGILSSTNVQALEDVITALEQEYKVISVSRGNVHDYLNLHMCFDKVNGTVEITQATYIQKLVDMFPEARKVAITPHTENLFKVNTEAPLLTSDERERFHSVVASALYLAVKTRPDILVVTNFLSTRVKADRANVEDWNKLKRLISYLKGTTEIGIILGGDETGTIELKGYADASYGVHQDAKSHTGLFITLGRGPILVKSYKQKCVTKSSCEAEIIALSDMTSLIMWFQEILTDISGHVPKTTIFEDNMSAIQMVQNGVSSSDRSRHVHIRNMFVEQFVTSGKIDLLHCPTKEMIADMMTKPLPVPLYLYLRDYLLGYKLPKKGCVGR